MGTMEVSSSIPIYFQHRMLHPCHQYRELSNRIPNCQMLFELQFEFEIRTSPHVVRGNSQGLSRAGGAIPETTHNLLSHGTVLFDLRNSNHPLKSFSCIFRLLQQTGEPPPQIKALQNHDQTNHPRWRQYRTCHSVLSMGTGATETTSGLDNHFFPYSVPQSRSCLHITSGSTGDPPGLSARATPHAKVNRFAFNLPTLKILNIIQSKSTFPIEAKQI